MGFLLGKDNLVLICSRLMYLTQLLIIKPPSSYIVDSVDLWHGRLGHVNFSYLKKMKDISLLSNISVSNIGKCDICVESKATKKTCNPILKRETKLLNLIHNDLGDLKQTMTRGGKRFYVTFIDDLSRDTKVYLLRNKDEVGEKFSIYKNEVENQLGKKIKKLRTNRGREYESNMFNAFVRIMAFS